MLACERHGRGEPLVLVHGLTHRRQAWYPVLERLAEQREVILVDLPGHGESPALVDDGRPLEDVLRETFREFLDEQGLDRPHVAGNSLGGRIALEAGAAGDARSVTALSPAGFWGSDTGFAYTRRLFQTMSSLGTRLGPQAPRLVRSRTGRMLMYGWITAHPSRLSPDCALGDFRAFQAALPVLPTMLAAATPFTAEIPDDVPVTVAWAVRDRVLPLWQADIAREHLPRAHHVTMKGVGHVPMTDDPEQVARVLLEGSAPVAGVRPLSHRPDVRSRGGRIARRGHAAGIATA